MNKISKFAGVEINGWGMRPIAKAFGIEPTIEANPELTMNDHRKGKELKTHNKAVIAYDPGMSGWGGARGGKSYCAWACAPFVDVLKVGRWVSKRGDLQDVQIVDLDTYTPPKDVAHFTIYVCNKGHAATQ